MRKLLFLCIVLLTFGAQAQELNCEVIVNAQQTGNENQQIYKTLERQLKEFINNTRWTDRRVKPQERIDCSMVINISQRSGDNFEAELQVRSSRPIFNSSYSSPVYNFSDEDFNFEYFEFQNFNFSPTQFQSNLVSVLAFHVYIILGLDADTFAPNGGQEYFEQARTIVGYSQQENAKGWEPPRTGDQTRSQLLGNILSSTYKEYRTVMYQYHRNALDNMSEDPKKSKSQIANSVSLFFTMNNRRPNSFVLRTFFDAKAEEIEDIFSGGPSVNISEFVGILNKIAPTHSSKWRNISF